MKLSFGKIGYKHFNNRAVTCKLPFSFNYRVTDDEELNMFFEFFLSKILQIKQPKTFMEKGVCTGRAVCHKNDTYDETLGERIAESRAKLEAYTHALKSFTLLAKVMQKATNNINANVEKLTRLVATEEEHLNRLSK